MTDSTAGQHYSTKAEVYAQSRPDFDPTALASFVENSGLTVDSVVADIGAGTGRLTHQLLDHFSQVYAVEPNADMRQIAMTQYHEQPGFHSIGGTAENIPLPTDRVDLITAGQAIHWFEPEAARAEFRRIGKARTWLYTARILPLDTELNAAVGAVFADENRQVNPVEHPGAKINRRKFYFTPETYQIQQFPHVFPHTWEIFLGGMRSASFGPTPDEPKYSNFVAAARAVFEQFSENDILPWQIATEIEFGILI